MEFESSKTTINNQDVFKRCSKCWGDIKTVLKDNKVNEMSCMNCGIRFEGGDIAKSSAWRSVGIQAAIWSFRCSASIPSLNCIPSTTLPSFLNPLRRRQRRSAQMPSSDIMRSMRRRLKHTLERLVRCRIVDSVDSIGLAVRMLSVLRSRQRRWRVCGYAWSSAAQNPRAPSPTASFGALMPRPFRSVSASSQLSADSRTPSATAKSRSAPCSSTPINTRAHSLTSSARSPHQTPARICAQRRSDRSGRRHCSISPFHCSAGRDTREAENPRASGPGRTCRVSAISPPARP